MLFRSVTTTNFDVHWSLGPDVEAITEIYWKGGLNLTGSLNLTSSFNVGYSTDCAAEYFGNSWAPPDGGPALVGGGTTGGWNGTTLTATTAHVGLGSWSSGCPTSTNISVKTAYDFFDAGWSNPNRFTVARQFLFQGGGFNQDFRPYIPRLDYNLGFTEVLYPTQMNTLAAQNISGCPTGCTGPHPEPYALPLSPLWDATQGWFAMHNPATGQGVVIRRKSTSPIEAQLWVDQDFGSHSNASSFLLRSPSGGFQGLLTETETFCFYDSSLWTPSLTPPPGCLSADWPQFRRDPPHDAYNSGETYLNPSTVGAMTPRWSKPTGGFIYSSPAVASGMVYVGSNDGKQIGRAHV